MSRPIKKALVAPLNWGLGHATRCIPIINALIDRNVEVILASDGQAFELLVEEFPDLKAVRLPSLQIHYRDRFIWSMAGQSAKFIKSIREDRKAIVNLMDSLPIDYIFSDNRYGLYHRNALNILLTHQLQIVKPKIFKLPSRLFIKKLIKKFDYCWIPDVDHGQNLTGEMSSPQLGIPKTYIGVISRFDQNIETNSAFETAIILSGPEPARTNFENKSLNYSRMKAKICNKTALVRGVLLEHSSIKSTHPKLEIFDFLNAQALNKLILGTPKIVCRSGYSSIMDLVQVSKKAQLIPTPGQLEQEYLAKRLGQQEIFFVQSKVGLI